MDEVTTYRFQMEVILDALRLTANHHNSRDGKTCFDRQVKQAEQLAKNALDGKKEIVVRYSDV